MLARAMPVVVGMRRATHTISNASTFHGWLESTGLDDIIKDPCSCIFGDDEDNEFAGQPVPIPGKQRKSLQGKPPLPRKNPDKSPEVP